MNRAIKTITVALLVAMVGIADEVSTQTASLAVRNWIRLNDRPMNASFKGRHAGRTRSFTNDTGRVLFHVVEMEREGFVVTSGDTKISPIIAFSDSGTFDMSDDNPLFGMLKGDMANRVLSITSSKTASMSSKSMSTGNPKASGLNVPNDPETEWRELVEVDESGAESVSYDGVPSPPKASQPEIDDARVSPMLMSAWEQSGKWSGNYIYNLYTPSHYVCGCTATAVAQVMRYWEEPKASVDHHVVNCQVDNVATDKTMIGGTYDWSKMPLATSDITDQNQCEMIGRLCYDVGVASKMNWRREGSGAALGDATQGLIQFFGYKSAETVNKGASTGSVSAGAYANAILGSLNGGMPAVIGIYKNQSGTYPQWDPDDYKSGHTVVADGYGYHQKNMYVHVNVGYGAKYNVWYNLFGEMMTAGGNTWDSIWVCIVNIHPTQSGSVISGRVADSDGRPFNGAVVRVKHVSSGVDVEAQTNSRGIWHVRTSRTGDFEVQVVPSSTSSAHSEISEINLSSGNLWNVDLVAVQEAQPSTYVLEVNPNDGILVGSNFGSKEGTSQSASVTVTYGSINYWYLGTATRDGYSFDGWWTDATEGSQVYDSAGKAKTGSIYWDTSWQWIYAGNLSIYAHWIPNGPTPTTSTISFNSNGGTFSNGAATKTVEATPGNLWGKLPMPSMPGYVFDGWYTAASGGDIITASSVVPNGNTTYYAHWSPRLGLAAASEWPYEFTTDSWCGQGTVAHDGKDALRSGIIYDGQSSYLITRVTGPGTLTFWWAVSCEGGGNDALRFLVDGEQKQMISGEVDWTKVTVNIAGAGTHTLKWNYTKNGSVTKGEDFGWVDQIAWTSVPDPGPVLDSFVFDANGGKFSNGASVKKTDATPGNLWGKMYMPAKEGQVFVGWYTAASGGTLVTASDAVPDAYCTYYAHWTPRLGLAAASEWPYEFTTDSWCGQGAVAHDGTDALRSGIIYDRQNSYLMTKVNGAGVLTFWWKVSCEGSGYDALRFLVDGEQKAMITGEIDWKQVSISITGSGTHTLKWNYTKDGVGTKGQDFGWIDQMSWQAK